MFESFPVLTITKDAMHTCIQVCVEITLLFLLSEYPEVEWLSCMESVYLTLRETAKLFAKRLYNFTFSQEMHGSLGCPCLHQISYCWSFHCSHSTGYAKGISHYYFNLTNDAEYLFLCFLVICIYSGEMSDQIFCPFEKLSCLSFCYILSVQLHFILKTHR